MPVASDVTRLIQPLVLLVHLCAEHRSYKVTFAPGLDSKAAEFVKARESYCAIWIDEEFEGGLVGWPETEKVLYPECEHGLSLWLCAGPEHYPADAECPW
jgi:hypothetical protein